MMPDSTVRLSYERHGNGFPLILLHGYPLNRTIWREALPFLEDIADVILPDLRGHGESPVPAGEYLMDTMAADVIALMDELKIPQAILAGHSMGGYVALSLLKMYPTRFLGLGLVATQAAADSPERRQGRMETVEQVKKNGTSVVTDAMISKLTSKVELYPQLERIMAGASVDGLVGSLLGMAGREDARAWITQITVPTLIASGGKDAINPRERPEEMATLIPKSWWVELPEAGHMPMMEEPQATGLALRSLVISTLAKKPL